MAVSPKSMAIILLFAVAVLCISTAASSSMQPPPLPPRVLSVEACVELLFDPPQQPPLSTETVLCRDMLRAVSLSLKVTGKLSPEYLAAVKKVPKFQNNPEALNKFLCGLSSSVAGCDMAMTKPTL